MDDLEVVISMWRMSRGIPSGAHIWFDPTVESVRLFRVPTAEQRSLNEQLLERVDSREEEVDLDKVGSVSAGEDEDESYVSGSPEQGFLLEEEEPLPF